MRLLVCLLGVVIFISPAYAVELEYGSSNYQTAGDGIWYQRPFPHRLSLRPTAWEISQTLPANDWISLRGGYFDLGHVHSDAMATGKDAWYDSVNGTNLQPSEPLQRFVGDGHVRGFSLIPLVIWREGKLHAAAGIGVTRFRSDWSMHIYANNQWYDYAQGSVHRWADGKVYLLGIGYGRVTFYYKSYSGLGAKGFDTNNSIPIYSKSSTFTLSIALGK